MKKILVTLMICAFALTSVNSFAQTAQEKAEAREAAKERAQELKEEGWHIRGSQSMVEALTKMNLENCRDGIAEIFGMSYNCESAEQAKNVAANDAYKDFAKRTGFITGRDVNSINNYRGSTSEFDSLNAEMKMELLLKSGDIIILLYFERKNNEGKYDYQCMALAEENHFIKAKKAKAERDKDPYYNAEKISDFITRDNL